MSDYDVGRRFNIGAVFSGGWQAIRNNPVQTIGLSFVFAIVPLALNQFVFYPELQGAAAFTRPGLNASVNWSGLAPFYAISILFLCAQYPAVIRACVFTLEGRRDSFGSLIFSGVRKALPFLLLGVIAYIATIIGSLLLVVPAILLMIRWSAAAQVLAVEDKGVFGSFGRSNALTRGSRGKIFLLGLIGLFLMIPFAGLYVFALRPVGNAMLAPEVQIPVALVSVLVTTFGIALASAFYVELRRVADGTRPEQLAEVFA